jgi:parallel beta-helix repeat protein
MTMILKKIVVILGILNLSAFIGHNYAFAQNAMLKAQGDITSDSIILFPQTAKAATDCNEEAEEGTIYYNSYDEHLYYCNGSGWVQFGAGGGDDRYVATRIVAASNSLGTTGCPGACTNPRADYTCDGTDDQLKIQEAIDALGTTGGTVYLLEGTYNISGSINLDNVANLPDDLGNDSGKAIIGAGAGTVLQVMSGASNVNVINASGVSSIFIAQLDIDGNSRTGSDNYGINFNSVTDSKIEKVWVENMYGHGIVFTTSSNNLVSDNHISLNGIHGIELFNSNDNVVSDNQIINNNGQSSGGQGIVLDSSSNNILSRNNIQSTLATKHLYGVAFTSSDYNVFSNNSVQSSVIYGIVLDSSFNNTLISNNIQSNGFAGIVAWGASNNIISGNVIYDHTGYGIKLEDDGSYSASGDNNTVTANIIYNSGSGITIEYSDNNLIFSNHIKSTSGSNTGINILTGGGSDLSESNYLSGNLIGGAGISIPVNDSGTRTKYTDKTKVTLSPGTYQTLVNNGTLTPDYPTNHLQLNPTANRAFGSATNPTIAAGKTGGDILILENISASYTIQLKDFANVKLKADPRTLGRYDTITFIWNGVDWVEIAFSNNAAS